MRIQLSDHFTYGRLLRFAFPTMVMMLFTSMYTIVDGLFVSNIAGKVPFSAVNLVMPFLYLLSAPGYMLGTGGTAVVATTLGRGRSRLANGYFSRIMYTAILVGLAMCLFGEAILRPLLISQGAAGEVLEQSLLYGRILFLGIPFLMVQDALQSFFVAAEKPRLGLMFIILAGLTNIVLDAVFMLGFGWGVRGAAAATILGMAVGSVIPFIYFLLPNSSLLSLGRARGSRYMLRHVCTNGSSEMVGTASGSLVTALYNYQLMRLIGPDGVAAYGIVMYIGFILASLYMGYAMGVSPVISYHYGAENRKELQNLFSRSLHLLTLFGIIMTLSSLLSANVLTGLFVGYDKTLWAFTSHGMRLYGLAFLFSGFNYFASAFFTALGNGSISAGLSLSRTLLLETGVVLILPLFIGTNGIWLAFPVAEFFALLCSITCLLYQGSRYGYLPRSGHSRFSSSGLL